MKVKEKILAIIPARGGSKRIPGKNVKSFAGKPLIAYAIEQAKSVSYIDRVIVDTDSPKIRAIAKKYGAEVPFLRPKRLATDKAQVIDTIFNILKKLKANEGYVADYVLLLQTTSPLRDVQDIDRSYKLMKSGGADTVLTVCSTHPRLYHVDKKGYIIWVNKSKIKSTNIQALPTGYILNGCFVYLVKTKALHRERSIITRKTKAVICDKWRSVDLDEPEDWALAEVLFKHRGEIKSKMKKA